MKDLTEQLLLAKSGGIVTDGLVLWVDGRDGIYNRDGTKIPAGTTKTPYSDDVYVLNRVDGSLIQIEDHKAVKNAAPVNVVGDDTVIQFSVPYNADVDSGVRFADLQIADTVLTSEMLITNAHGITNLKPTLGNIETSNMIYVSCPSNQNSWGEQLFESKDTYYAVGTPIHVLGNAYAAGNKKRLYRNGELYIENGNNLPEPAYFVPQFVINSMSRLWARLIEFGSIRMYNRVLSADEVRQNYNFEKSIGRVN